MARRRGLALLLAAALLLAGCGKKGFPATVQGVTISGAPKRVAVLSEHLAEAAVGMGYGGQIAGVCDGSRLPGLEEGGPLPHFYRLLAEKGRMALLPEIVEAFHGLELARRGGARCVLTCVRPLEAEELEKLRAALCRLHHKKEVVFDVRTDPALLGGFTLDIEGVRYDKSVRGALGRMGRQLEERRMA